jgi:uncharacterized membrane protein YphA (DoxX/SURF4 family)
MGEGRNATMTNAALLLGRLLLAACFLPPAVSRLANISGLAASLTMKSLPYGDVVATLVVVAEIFAPLALLIGVAPRLSAGALLAATLVTTGTLHRFWDYAGLNRQLEQAIFLSHLGVMAGLLFYGLVGPGAWSWQAWWRGIGGAARPGQKRRKPARARTAKPRPAPTRSIVDDELADAA